MNRRLFLLAASLAGGLGLTWSLPAADNSAGIFRLPGSPNGQPLSARSKELREQLIGQLRPRSPEEFAFVDRVVIMVQRGDLPMDMVKAAFGWARRKRHRYRFPYFQRGMQRLATRQGIRI
jgi:hypothetical protein